MFVLQIFTALGIVNAVLVALALTNVPLAGATGVGNFAAMLGALVSSRFNLRVLRWCCLRWRLSIDTSDSVLPLADPSALQQYGRPT